MKTRDEDRKLIFIKSIKISINCRKKKKKKVSWSIFGTRPFLTCPKRKRGRVSKINVCRKPFLIRVRNASAGQRFRNFCFRPSRFVKQYPSCHVGRWSETWISETWFFYFHQIKNYIWSKIYYFVIWNNIWI